MNDSSLRMKEKPFLFFRGSSKLKGGGPSRGENPKKTRQKPAEKPTEYRGGGGAVRG